MRSSTVRALFAILPALATAANIAIAFDGDADAATDWKTCTGTQLGLNIVETGEGECTVANGLSCIRYFTSGCTINVATSCGQDAMWSDELDDQGSIKPIAFNGTNAFWLTYVSSISAQFSGRC